MFQSYSNFRYYHSRTGAPIHPEHLEWDSDDDVDHEWLVQQVGAVRQLRLPAPPLTHSGCATLWSIAARGVRCSAWARVCTIEGFCGHRAVATAYSGRGTGRPRVGVTAAAAAAVGAYPPFRSLLTAAC